MGWDLVDRFSHLWHRETVLRRIVIVASALALLLAGVELALRAAPSERVRERPARPAPPAGLPPVRGLKDLVRKSHRGLFRGTLYETNARGIRDREYATPKPPGTFRVVVVGGSNVMGSWVDADDTYASRVERELTATSKSPIEVVNVAIAGANLEVALARLERIGLAYEPDLIVYGFNLTDIRLPGVYSKTATPTGRNGSADSSSALVRAARALGRDLAELLRMGGTYAAEIHENYAEGAPAWQAFRRQLDRLAETGRSSDACVIVLLHTHPESLNARHAFHDVYERVAKAAERRGLSVAHSFDLYEGETDRSMWAAPGNKHANEWSHEILAAALRRGLTNLPASCWKGAKPGPAR